MLAAGLLLVLLQVDGLRGPVGRVDPAYDVLGQVFDLVADGQFGDGFGLGAGGGGFGHGCSVPGSWAWLGSRRDRPPVGVGKNVATGALARAGVLVTWVLTRSSP